MGRVESCKAAEYGWEKVLMICSFTQIQFLVAVDDLAFDMAGCREIADLSESIKG